MEQLNWDNNVLKTLAPFIDTSRDPGTRQVPKAFFSLVRGRGKGARRAAVRRGAWWRCVTAVPAGMLRRPCAVPPCMRTPTDRSVSDGG